MKRFLAFAVGMAVGLGSNPSALRADENEKDATLPDGFQAHVRPAAGGSVDWADGFIIAEGLGKGEGRSASQMAKRGAQIVALRNALAISLGLKIDADGNFGNIQNGEVHIQGTIKGQKTISYDCDTDITPVECTAKVKVPIWGLKGVASVIYEAQVRKMRRVHRKRIVIAQSTEDVSGDVLIIDARGIDIEPCLFPAVIGGEAGALYDVTTIEKPGNDMRPTVRYVETDLTYEELRTDAGFRPPGFRRASVAGHATFAAADVDRPAACSSSLTVLTLAGGDPKITKPKPGDPTSRPTTRPARKGRRRRRVIKAVQGATKDKTLIQVTKEDAEKLAKSARGAALLRDGKVIVVVDSVAAGVQGRVDEVEHRMKYAHATGR